MPFYKRKVVWILAGLILFYLLLLIPDSEKEPIVESTSAPFIWDQDETWKYLESTFQLAQGMGEEPLDSMIQSLIKTAEEQAFVLTDTSLAPDDPAFTQLEVNFFSIAPLIAARQKHRPWLLNFYQWARIFVKKQSHKWDMEDRLARNTLYRLMYGMRGAMEEVLLQSDNLDFEAAMMVEDEPSQTPSTNIFGIEVHSGDLLVSRGGAAASAFISRGNDYPGNFSHVAMIYVEEKENRPYLVEAHIEKGVAIATVAEYLKDAKLRFMVLRPRADLPELLENPQLPQQAAKFAYDESLSRHIPYDFKMNFHDSTTMFCSEVGSFAYKKQGLELWKGESTISSSGVVDWLHTFGVEHFVTQMPSDLEYDPQLAIVAEWRDPQTLYKDHIDNAVMDAMWLSADKGAEITYNPMILPVARMLKGYCMVLNTFGTEGMIPEGMSAGTALKNNSFVEKYETIRDETTRMAEEFKKTKGYIAPYWQMVSMAEEAQEKLAIF